MSDYGHYLAYDDNLFNASIASNIGFGVYGNNLVPDQVTTGRPFFQKVFTSHSWTIGNRPAGPKSEDVREFRKELRAALENESEQDQLYLYMYCGSLEHAEVIMEVLSDFEWVRANINLFWLSFMDIATSEYRKRWRPFLRKAKRQQRMTLTLPTQQMAAEVRTALGVDLSVAPHPDTSIDDDKFNVLLQWDMHDSPSSPMRVLFPGGLRFEKGFDATATLVPRLAETGSNYAPIIRFFAPNNAPKKLILACDQLREHAIMIEGDLSREGFVQMFLNSDIVVLPYTPESFKNRTSGLLIDALYCGVPVVVVQGTWLAEVVEHYQSGIVVPEANDEELMMGINTIATQYTKFRTRSLSARTEFFQNNSWNALIDSIVTSSAANHRRTGWFRRRESNVNPGRN